MISRHSPLILKKCKAHLGHAVQVLGHIHELIDFGDVLDAFLDHFPVLLAGFLENIFDGLFSI